jgi:hypothetical protein
MDYAPPDNDSFTPQQQMVSRLIGADTSDTGCDIVALAGSPAAQGMSLSELRAACDVLSAEGHIYPTIDDDTFQLCDIDNNKPAAMSELRRILSSFYNDKGQPVAGSAPKRQAAEAADDEISDKKTKTADAETEMTDTDVVPRMIAA